MEAQQTLQVRGNVPPSDSQSLTSHALQKFRQEYPQHALRHVSLVKVWPAVTMPATAIVLIP
jgi:DNA-binding transcriptional LysR family regulator